jgi:hypothetical protein
MTLTEQDFAAQEEQLSQLKLEMARLDDAFAKNLKALGLTEADLKKIEPDKEPPEVKKLYQEAQAAAKRAGEDRAAAAKSQATPKKVAPSRRGGAVSV